MREYIMILDIVGFEGPAIVKVEADTEKDAYDHLCEMIVQLDSGDFDVKICRQVG